MTDLDATPELLEVRYRRWLRLLPGVYRFQHEQEMVDAFMESRLKSEPDNSDLTAIYGRPSVTEIVSVVGLALRLRWGGVGSPVRYRARTASTQRFVLILLALKAMLSVGLLITLIPAGAIAAPTAFDSSLWRFLGSCSQVLWVVAFVTVICGFGRACQVLVALAVAPSVVDGFAHPALVEPWAWLVVYVCLIVALGSFRRDTPRRPPGRWWLGAACGIVLIQAVWLIPTASRAWLLMNEVGWWLAALVVTTILTCTILGRCNAEEKAVNTLTLAAFGATILILCGSATADLRLWLAGEPDYRRYMEVSVVMFGVALVITVFAIVVTVRTTRSLPRPTYEGLASRN